MKLSALNIGILSDPMPRLNALSSQTLTAAIRITSPAAPGFTSKEALL